AVPRVPDLDRRLPGGGHGRACPALAQRRRGVRGADRRTDAVAGAGRRAGGVRAGGPLRAGSGRGADAEGGVNGAAVSYSPRLAGGSRRPPSASRGLYEGTTATAIWIRTAAPPSPGG